MCCRINFVLGSSERTPLASRLSSSVSVSLSPPISSCFQFLFFVGFAARTSRRKLFRNEAIKSTIITKKKHCKSQKTIMLRCDCHKKRA